MAEDEGGEITTDNDGAFFAPLLASLGLGEFDSVDALLLHDMEAEEFLSPHIAAGRDAAGASCKWSLCRYFKCVWVVLGVMAMVGGVVTLVDNCI